MAKLGVGVVGVGRMGRRHAENLRSLIPEAKLVAVADADLEAARRLAADLEIEHSYASIEDLVERKDIDDYVSIEISFIRSSNSGRSRQAHSLRKTAGAQHRRCR